MYVLYFYVVGCVCQPQIKEHVMLLFSISAAIFIVFAVVHLCRIHLETFCELATVIKLFFCHHNCNKWSHSPLDDCYADSRPLPQVECVGRCSYPTSLPPKYRLVIDAGPKKTKTVQIWDPFCVYMFLYHRDESSSHFCKSAKSVDELITQRKRAFLAAMITV